MRKYIILFILLVLVVISYNYIYQDHRNIETEQPEFKLTSDILINQFSESPINSEKKYLNKTIEVLGLVTEVSELHLVLNKKIFCQFTNSIDLSISKDTQVRIKGRCIGYDDLLEEIKLDQCIIILN